MNYTVEDKDKFVTLEEAKYLKEYLEKEQLGYYDTFENGVLKEQTYAVTTEQLQKKCNYQGVTTGYYAGYDVVRYNNKICFYEIKLTDEIYNSISKTEFTYAFPDDIELYINQESKTLCYCCSSIDYTDRWVFADTGLGLLVKTKFANNFDGGYFIYNYIVHKYIMDILRIRESESNTINNLEPTYPTGGYINFKLLESKEYPLRSVKGLKKLSQQEIADIIENTYKVEEKDEYRFAVVSVIDASWNIFDFGFYVKSNDIIDMAKGDVIYFKDWNEFSSVIKKLSGSTVGYWDVWTIPASYSQSIAMSLRINRVKYQKRWDLILYEENGTEHTFTTQTFVSSPAELTNTAYWTATIQLFEIPSFKKSDYGWE